MDIKDFDFRLWDRDRQRYIYSDPFSYKGILSKNETTGILYYKHDASIDFFENVDIELYIGLKDKNNTKIYQGDILQYIDTANKYMTRCVVNVDFKASLQKVITLDLNNGNFYEDVDVDLYDSDLYKNHKEYKILGNINQNSYFITKRNIRESRNMLSWCYGHK